MAGWKTGIIFVLLWVTASFVQGQSRYAFVNMEYILEHNPEYAKARVELDEYAEKLQAAVDEVYEEISELQSKYNSEKVFLTPNLREQREKEIAGKENKARLLQQQYFGPEGLLFQKREELIKPIQEEVLEVIQDVAKEGNFGHIIDVSADNSTVYYDSKLDRSKNVLRKLGYSTTDAADAE